jgi:DNA-binding LytR/AlgR family response regulator
MLEQLTCILVDDNPLDLDYLHEVVLLHPNLRVLKVCNNAIEAKEYITTLQPQVLFLDIDMPLFNGLELFKSLNYEPICVFVTAHSEYAWQSYEAMAFDFILKPVKIERFASIVQRIEEYFAFKSKVVKADSYGENDYLVIKEGYDKHKIMMNDILYVEALKDYTKVVTTTKKVMTLQNLKHFMEHLPAEKFIRVHRSYAVAAGRITKLDQHYVHINDYTIPVGKTYKQIIKQTI